MNPITHNASLAAAWHAAVVGLSDENATIEVVPRQADGTDLPQVRARVLGVSSEDRSIVIEKPEGQPAAALRTGVSIKLILMAGARRLQARSEVLSSGRIQLNAQNRITAVKLSPATQIASAQRRGCFRLDTKAMKIDPVELAHAAQPAYELPIKTRLLDISDRGLGLGLEADLESAREMMGRAVELSLKLPGQPASLQLVGRVVRVVEATYANAVLGIQFEFESALQQRRVENLVQQFSADQQRKQLRRTRGVG